MNYLLDNYSLTLGSTCFGKVIEMPMGSDPAPFMANLVLYYYERKLLLQVKKSSISKRLEYFQIFLGL